MELEWISFSRRLRSSQFIDTYSISRNDDGEGSGHVGWERGGLRGWQQGLFFFFF